MRFYRSKPLHGWRGFLGEIGVVLIGVLLALGAPQLVEAWKWRQLVEEQNGRELQRAYDAVTDINSALRINLRTDTASQWLTPFKPFLLSKTELAALKAGLLSLPYVQKPCRPML